MSPPKPGLKLNLGASASITTNTNNTVMMDTSSTVHNASRQGLMMENELTGTMVRVSEGENPIADFQEKIRNIGGSAGSLVVKLEDLEQVEELGAGNGGTVYLVRHKGLGKIMARKVIQLDLSPAAQRNIYNELQILLRCESPYIVNCYGTFVDSVHVSVCMEFMDVGSLDRLYRLVGGFQEEYIGKIVESVLKGLVYLYESHRIIHRDIKPSNILLNSEGQIKICDFGVSGELINSIANSFVGTSSYMAPERIEGRAYNVQSDVWSLGMTLIELAMGKFPFPQPLSIFELLTMIVNEPPPALPPAHFSPEIVDFVNQCLIKDPKERPTPSELLQHPFVLQSNAVNVDLKSWAQELVHEIQSEK